MERKMTVKQLAMTCGVSKQAVHKKIKLLSTELTGELSTIDNKVYISEQGQKLIKSAFEKRNRQPVDNNAPSTVDGKVDGTVEALIQLLKDEIAVKNKELDTKNQQIADLSERLAEANAALVSAQKAVEGAQALHASTVQQRLLEAPDTKEKKGFFSRFKKER